MQYEDDDQVYDCVIPRRDPPPPPFNEKDPRFLKAFRAILNSGDYDDLLTDIDEKPGQPWYDPRMGDMRLFWQAVKDEYNKL